MRNRSFPFPKKTSSALFGSFSIGATVLLIIMAVFDSTAQTNASSTFQPTNEMFLTFTNRQGRVYDSIKVLKILPDGIRYTVKDGAGGGKIIFADMPEEYQRMFARMSPFLTEADRKQFEEIKFRAQTGDSQAQAELGRCYANGRGTPTNGVEAVTWFRKAAEQGNAVGENGLGVCYRRGFGVAKNADEAVKWFIKAAEQGNAKAQFNLGECYEDGFGVPLNAVVRMKEAVEWYEKSAAQGFISSQVKLAILYYQGIGVTKDPAVACKWLELASAHTEEEYKEEARKAKELLASMRKMIVLEPYLNGDLASADSNSPVTQTMPQKPVSGSRPNFEIISLATKLMEEKNLYWRWSYQLRARNNTSEPIHEFPKIEFLDAQGFIIEEKTCEVNLSGGETKDILGTAIIDLPGAAQVKTIKAE